MVVVVVVERCGDMATLDEVGVGSEVGLRCGRMLVVVL